MNLLLIVKMRHLNSVEYRRVIYQIHEQIPSMYPVYDDGDCNERFDEWFRNLLEMPGTVDNGLAHIEECLIVQMVQDADSMYHLRPLFTPLVVRDYEY